MLKQYLAYIKNNPQGYWFKRKIYGWGWTPARWQGWFVLLAYIIFIPLNFYRLDSVSHSGSDTAINFIPQTVIFTLLLIAICWKKGEPPRWQWGLPGHENEKTVLRTKKIFQVIIFIAICEFVGTIGSIFTVSSVSTWYVTLVKPALNPPSWLFGPVWTTLYALMGVAAYLVWSAPVGAATKFTKKQKYEALAIFDVQLFLNMIWSILFFGLHSPAAALVDIILLWVAIVWTMIVFYRITRPAAYLLLPYLVWVSFAVYLNYSIWLLN